MSFPSLCEEVVSLANGDASGIADWLTRRSAAERDIQAFSKDAALLNLDDLRAKGQSALKSIGSFVGHPAIAGSLLGAAGGGAIGAATAKPDEEGVPNRRRGALSGALAGMGLGGGIGLAYATSKGLLPKIELNRPDSNLPPALVSKLPKVVDQISELERESPVAAPFNAVGRATGGYVKNHPFLSMLGAADVGSNVLGGLAGVTRQTDPRPTLRPADLLRGGKRFLESNKGVLDKEDSGLRAKIKSLLTDGIGNRKMIQRALIRARKGAGSARSGLSPQELTMLAEMGRGPMGGFPELVDTLNTISRSFTGKERFDPLALSGYGAVRKGPLGKVLRFLSSSGSLGKSLDTTAPTAMQRILPRLGIYGGIPIAQMGISAMLGDMAKRQQIKRLVNQLQV